MSAEEELIKKIKTHIVLKKITIGDSTINYIQAGKGDPLILLHGVTIGWGQWHPNIAALAKHFTVYALDLPGAGGSTKIHFKNSDLEKDFVSVVGAFITRHKLKHVTVIGHSIGGWIAVKLAARKQLSIKKLILVDPVGISTYVPWKYKLISSHTLAFLLSHTVVKPTKDNIASFLRSVLHTPSVVKKEFIDYAHEATHRGRTLHPFFLINRITGFNKVKKEFLLLEELATIRIPTLLIMGANDPLIPLKKIVSLDKFSSTVTMRVIADVGHVPSLEKSYAFNKLVINFLK